MQTVVIPLKEPCGALEGETLIYRRDPIFGIGGWCIKCGNLILEMQSMQWVDKLVTKRGTTGMMGVVKNKKLIIEAV
jgi:hypothetical protein